MPNPLSRDLDHVLAHTGGLWDDLRGSRIFVTGGTGFFGCWLLESFAWACDALDLNATMTVLTRSPEAFRAKAPHLAGHRAVNLVAGDVRTFAFPAGGFTHVIHGATDARAQLIREQPDLMLDTIVDGTRRTLQFAKSAGASRFLLLSSGAIYGPQPPSLDLVPETWRGGPDPADKRSVYAEGKRIAELLCCLSGMDCLIARCFAFVGPYLPLDVHFAIGNFIGDCLANRRIEIAGDGTPLRSYLYAADLMIWLWTILLRGEPGRPYNVGAENAHSIGEIAAVVAGELGSSAGVRIARTAQPGIPAERYIPDTGRARRELGLRERISLEEGIRRTAEWHSPHAVPAALNEEALSEK